MQYGMELRTAAAGPEQTPAAESLTISGSPTDGVLTITLELDSVALVSHQEVGEITTAPAYQDPWIDLDNITTVVFELEAASHGSRTDTMTVYVSLSNITGLVEADGIVWTRYTVDKWTASRAYTPDRSGR